MKETAITSVCRRIQASQRGTARAEATFCIAEDHRLVAEGILALLAERPSLRLAGIASDGLSAVGMVEALQPDLLLLDLGLPRLHGLEVLARVRRCKQTRVLVLTIHALDHYVLAALRAGAAGYLLKDCAVQDLFSAIDLVLAGKRYISPELAELCLVPSLARGRQMLSRREIEVLELAATGARAKDIAHRLFISERTVETHRDHIHRKLELSSQTDLVRYAVRHGIIPA